MVKRALVIGINKYTPKYTDLKYACKDAEDLCKIFERMKFDEITRLIDKDEPTRDKIISSLDELIKECKKEDLIWVHFSCHGAVKAGLPVLIPYSKTEGEIQPLEQIEVIEILRKSAASQIILTLDACNQGAVDETLRQTGQSKADESASNNPVLQTAAGIWVMAASTSFQGANEAENLKNGVMTKFLLEKLTNWLNSMQSSSTPYMGLSVAELQNYVHEKVTIWCLQNHTHPDAVPCQIPCYLARGTRVIVLPPPPHLRARVSMGSMRSIGVVLLVFGIVAWLFLRGVGDEEPVMTSASSGTTAVTVLPVLPTQASSPPITKTPTVKGSLQRRVTGTPAPTSRPTGVPPPEGDAQKKKCRGWLEEVTKYYEANANREALLSTKQILENPCPADIKDDAAQRRREFCSRMSGYGWANECK